MSVLLVNSAPLPAGAGSFIAPRLSRHEWNIGLTLNDLQVWPRYRLYGEVEGLRDSADIEDERDPVPGGHGEVVRHAVRRGKTVSYKGEVQGLTPSQVWAARDRLLAAFAGLNPEGTMKVTLDPQFPVDDGLYAPTVTYRARPLQVIAPDVALVERGVGFLSSPFAVTLRMSDARLFDYLVTGPIVLGLAAVNVRNPGTAEAEPSFTARGPFTVLNIYNDTVGVTWRLVHTAVAGDVIDIDFLNKTVIKNGIDIEYGVDYTITDWWDETIPGLAPGDNFLRATYTGAGTGTSTEVTFRAAYR